MVEAAPASPFKVAETQFLLQLFVVALDDPPMLGHPHQILKLRLRRQRGNPVLGRFGFSLRPFDEKPFFRVRLRLPVIPMGGPDAKSGEAGAEGPMFAGAPRDGFPRGSRESDR